MSFNNPFHPLYAPFLQGMNPISPWIVNSGIPFPLTRYPSPVAYPFPPHASNNPFLIQQNNFYSSNSTLNTSPRAVNLFNNKPWIQKERHDPNQKKAILLQEQLNKSQSATKNKHKIAEIIEINDSDEQKIVNKQQTIKQKNLPFVMQKGHKQKLNTYKNDLKSNGVKSNSQKNRLQTKIRKGEELDLIINQKLQNYEGGLRRSKRNSEKYVKKIRKIIQEEMGTDPCPKQSSKQLTQKIKQQPQNLGEDSLLDKQPSDLYFQRAVLPTFLNAQVGQSWKATKKEDLLLRTIN